MVATMRPQELRRRAISRALAMGGAGAVTRLRYGHYRVASATRPGVTHTVSVLGQNWFCTCEAARAGRPCWHQAAVLVAKTEAGGGRVTGPRAERADDPALPANVTVLRGRAA